jgi:hypothetical protein
MGKCSLMLIGKIVCFYFLKFESAAALGLYECNNASAGLFMT